MKKIDKSLVKKIIPERSDKFNKTNFGKVLVIAGSYPMMGACYLTSNACIKSGCGLVYSVVIDKIKPYLSSVLPEVIFYSYKTNKDYIDERIADFALKLHRNRKFDVILIGPGIGNNTNTSKAVFNILKKFKDSNIPFIIDADGINVLSGDKRKLNILKYIPSILTPHTGEARRIAGNIDDDIKLLEKINQMTSSVVVLKNYRTLITDGKDKYLLDLPNSALSKAGSGDVLSGIMASILAQKIKKEKDIQKILMESAICAVWIHSQIAFKLSQIKTKYTITATDLIENIDLAFKELI